MQNDTIKWNNQQGSRDRRAWALVVHNGKVFRFRGETIPGVAVATAIDAARAGKWSSTTFEVVLAPGARFRSGLMGWETGRWTEALATPEPSTWAEVGNILGVSARVAAEFVREQFPSSARRIDEREAAIAALDAVADEIDADPAVVVNVAIPRWTRRDQAEGRSRHPLQVPGFQAELRLRPEGWWSYAADVELVGIQGRILEADGSTITVAVVPGTECPLPPFVSDEERRAAEAGIPLAVFVAARGDVDAARKFLSNLATVDWRRVDPHIAVCGRGRRAEELIRVSGNPDFWGPCDPNAVWGVVRDAAESAGVQL